MYRKWFAMVINMIPQVLLNEVISCNFLTAVKIEMVTVLFPLASSYLDDWLPDAAGQSPDVEYTL